MISKIADSLRRVGLLVFVLVVGTLMPAYAAGDLYVNPAIGDDEFGDGTEAFPYLYPSGQPILSGGVA